MTRAGAIARAALALAAAGLVRAADQPRTEQTYIGRKGVTLTARIVGNTPVIETKGPDGPWHFLVDTGTSRTLVSPEVAQALASKGPPPVPSEVPVRAADGKITVLPAAILNRLNLGGAKFEDIPVLVYDCSALSEQLGVPIDGILGFSLFRDTQLTIDYPQQRVILKLETGAGPTPGDVIALDPAENIPVAPVKLGARTLSVVVDSGKDLPLSLNRSDVSASDFGFGPVDGPGVQDLMGGGHPERIGRLRQTLRLGGFLVSRPVADVGDSRSSIGGGLLKNFTVVFDQQRHELGLLRSSPDPIAIPGQRSAGLSFVRNGAYWRVAAVTPGSPAAQDGVSEGDLVTKISGEPVAAWDKVRYDSLLANATQIRFTFLDGLTETEKTIPVADLVP